MTDVVIDNPILNSPFDEPKRHFRFGEDGITDEVVEERRISTYFMPIAQSKKKGKQQAFETEWTRERMKENELINKIRKDLDYWRQSDRPGLTRTTRQLLDYWLNEDRERRLFFCQIEALETIIYITEVAPKTGKRWIENELREGNQGSNPDLFRIALKMATGSGKTVVMAMLIAWHTLNKLANPQDARFNDAFLIVTPGITIKDRLRVLMPNDPNNYYKELDIVPSLQLPDLGQAKIVITNFHTFLRRERVSMSKLNKQILKADETGAFTESEGEMVRRVCRELGNKRNIVVLNDEAHHCYRSKPAEEGEKLAGDEKKEAQEREKEARIWINGLEAVKRKLGVRAVYDLSATPFFLRGSGYGEGTLFPWVVSDFSLIDAIEAGIVKVPRVPVADDSMTGEQPTYRDLWTRVKDELPKKGWTSAAAGSEPDLPAELEGALQSLYGDYRKRFEAWEKIAGADNATPPVFIVVCSNTSVSKLVFDYIAGWEKELPDGSKQPVTGKLPLFSNVEDGRWSDRPNTVLVDSRQLESGEAMSDSFKKLASTQIEEFKSDYRDRFPGRDVDQITDEELLREVMNTVGKPGRLGEHVRCVVSVAMLTEGWDANTVTHILGVRAFSTQLLCEQVVGRGLRRMSYSVNADGMFEPEYAEIYGVPFSFIPSAGAAEVAPKPPPTRVRALEERIAKEIRFPRLTGYRFDIASETIEANFSDDSHLAISLEDIASKTEMEPIKGTGALHTLDDLKAYRMQTIAFEIADQILRTYFRDEVATDRDPESQPLRPWLFPQLVAITKRWIDEYLVCKSGCFPQMLWLAQYRHDAADRIYKAIVRSQPGEPVLKPILHRYEPEGTSRVVDFDTVKSTWETDADKCHVSHVVGDSGWELKAAQVLDEMDEVDAYVKNQGLGFTIPYSIDGQERQYLPDFIVRFDDGARNADGTKDLLNLVVEVTGENMRYKKAKVSTARDLWIPAVNNHAAFGRWFFIEVTDPYDMEETLRAAAGGHALVDKLTGDDRAFAPAGAEEG
ncbi:MAG: DEAD/DEAH box helicase family protein [Actinobacteria bacterium]|nr:DEAD/DEAH box helicase family protein [Actinomycetota bacterium]